MKRYFLGVLSFCTVIVFIGCNQQPGINNVQNEEYSAKLVNGKELIVESHQGKSGNDLYYRVGQLNSDNTISWKSMAYYTSGRYPSIAINNNGIIIETHVGQSSNDLYYRVGTLNSDFTISWRSIAGYTSGIYTAICIDDQNRVVEVHRGKSDENLYYRTGYINSDYTISWLKIAGYTTGTFPSISIANDGTIVDVHSDKDADPDCELSHINVSCTINKLYYRTGQINWSSDGSISWKTIAQYTDGLFANVSLNSDGKVVEVHKDKDQQNKLYYWVGSINKNSNYSITWSYKANYTTGTYPSVSLNNDQNKLLEVHRGSSSNDLYYRVGTINSNSSISWLSMAYYTTGTYPNCSF